MMIKIKIFNNKKFSYSKNIIILIFKRIITIKNKLMISLIQTQLITTFLDYYRIYFSGNAIKIKSMGYRIKMMKKKTK